jgi:ketosteroid isomerase-like protein
MRRLLPLALAFSVFAASDPAIQAGRLALRIIPWYGPYGLTLADRPRPAEAAPSLEELEAEVRAREEGFARSMADRDHAAFVEFLAEDAVFNGPQVLRGREAVAEGWKPFFEGPEAPFSWKPERVAVAASGTVALSTGPVFAPDGKRSGTFTSTWRRDPDGSWRIVLDSGCPPCACE